MSAAEIVKANDTPFFTLSYIPLKYESPFSKNIYVARCIFHGPPTPDDVWEYHNAWNDTYKFMAAHEARFVWIFDTFKLPMPPDSELVAAKIKMIESSRKFNELMLIGTIIVSGPSVGRHLKPLVAARRPVRPHEVLDEEKEIPAMMRSILETDPGPGNYQNSEQLKQAMEAHRRSHK